MATIAVVGTGYVGLVSGALLADFGHTVVCMDIDTEKIAKLQEGVVPIYEPGLEPVVQANLYYKRLRFTTDLKEAVTASDVVFIAVGTPPADDGSADVHFILDAARQIALYMDDYKVVVNKSTAPVGTARQVQHILRETLAQRKVSFDCDVVSNPEFLREGSAVQDFTHPDRVVIGTESERAAAVMKEVYRVLYLNETPVVETNLETAEMIKYAANAFLATKITFINELANVCERVGANVQQVAHAMGQDGRISPKFLHPGPGYGGSCFPKDTKALAALAKSYRTPLSLVEATIAANERQKLLMVHKITAVLGENLKGKVLAILGITFKPNTDDMREAPALVILPELVKRGAHLQIADPQGHKEGPWRLSAIASSISWCTDAYEAIRASDATVLLTEWNQFRNLEFSRYDELQAKKVLFDLRNIYRRTQMESLGFSYYGVGV